MAETTGPHAGINIAPPGGSAVTIVTQTRVMPGQESAFKAWQESVSSAAAAYPGFLDQDVLPPSPPAQVDWVILQRFSSSGAAREWLNSPARTQLLEGAQGLLAGNLDIHLIADGKGVLPSPVSAVISTRLKPGQEEAYRIWEQRIAAAQARSPGFQGYRLEPPTPGVQDSWLAIVRFDSDANLDRWMKSAERLQLIKDSELFSDEIHARVVRSGFDQWFRTGNSAESQPPSWKMSMIVLLALYPVVFLFDYFVQTPLLRGRLALRFWDALFIANIFSVVVLDFLVPRIRARFDWWLKPQEQIGSRLHWKGFWLILGIYATLLLVFSQVS